MTALWILLGLVVVLAFWFVVIYNGLVAARNEVDNSWSQIDVQLKRRHDLIPNLVETVRGYAKHEQQLFERITEARAAAMQAQSAATGAAGAVVVAKAENLLGGALAGIMAVAEAYPDLKASNNFLALQEELSSTENRIGFSRQAFNDAVNVLNTRREVFPANLISGGFERREFFQLDEVGERAVPSAEV